MNKYICFSILFILLSTTTTVSAKNECTFGVNSKGSTSHNSTLGSNFSIEKFGTSYRANTKLTGISDGYSLAKDKSYTLDILTTNFLTSATPNYEWNDNCQGQFISNNETCTNVTFKPLGNIGDRCYLFLSIQDGLGGEKVFSRSYTISEKEEVKDDNDTTSDNNVNEDNNITNDEENGNIDSLTPRLGLTLSNTSVIEGDVVDLILTTDKPLEQAINISLRSSDSTLTLDNGYSPYTLYLPQGTTQSNKISIRMPPNQVLDDIRNITLSASTNNIITNTPSVALRVYEGSDSSEKPSKDIKLLSGFDLGNVYITQNALTRKSVDFYVTNTSNQNKSVKVKVIRQLGQKNILFDSERDCTVFVGAGRTESCAITLRFDEDAPSGKHSLKIVGSASGGSHFTEYKSISVVNQLNQYNYSIINRVKSSVTQKLGDILDYGSPVVKGRGNGNCIHQMPYKFYLKSLANNQITTVSQGYVDVCDDDITLDQQSSIRLDQSGTYQFWAQIFPPFNSDSDTSDNQSKIMTVTVGNSNKSDLSIGLLTIPSTVKQSENISLTVKVDNIGDKISTSTQVSVYSSNNVNNYGSVGLGDQQIAIFNVSAISGNNSQSFGKDNISFSQLGNKYIYACVTAISNEKSTSNNCSTSKKVIVEENDPLNESKSPLAANLVTPSGNINDNTPTYQWNAVATSTWYYLYVRDSTGNGKITKWYTAKEASCENALGTCSITPSTELALGKATWWVKTWNKHGEGPWSNSANFNIKVSEPVVTTYQLSVDSNFTIHRSGQLGDNLTLVIEKDGNIVLERYAKNELEYKYFRNTKGSNFRVWLKKYVDGGYKVVSNVIEYTVR